MLKVPIKIDGPADSYDTKMDNRPSAVFTVSGKLAYLTAI